MPASWSRFGSIPFQRNLWPITGWAAPFLNLIRKQGRKGGILHYYSIPSCVQINGCIESEGIWIRSFINGLQEGFEAVSPRHRCVPTPTDNLNVRSTANCRGSMMMFKGFNLKTLHSHYFTLIPSPWITSALDAPNRPGTSLSLHPLAAVYVLLSCSLAASDTSPFVSFRNHSPLMSFGASFVSFLVSVEGLKVAEEFLWEHLFVCSCR